MTPEEKAKELFDKYNYFLPDAIEINKEHLKYCALIAVNEILDIYWNLPGCGIGSKLEYWKKVKREIQKL